MNRSAAASAIKQFTRDNKIGFFSKSYCPFCNKLKDFFKANNVVYDTMELDKLPEADMNIIQDILNEETGIRSVPNVWINNEFAGDSSAIYKQHEDRKLFTRMHGYDYDLIVLGGGSGGLAASKKAASFGRKVACLDFVKPTPTGTRWGLGGTCVNVGCIPKKLMHTAALQHDEHKSSIEYGWDLPEKNNHDWAKMVQNVTDYICSLNFGYRTELRSKKVEYINAYGSLVDNKTVQYTRKGETKTISAERILIAVGERPKYPADVPNVKEYTITSDDLFSYDKDPGKTLVIGASYVALECAGFLNGIGKDTTVMVRSIFLRGFDQQMAEKVGKYMQDEGVKFQRPCTLKSIEKIDGGERPQYKVVGNVNGGDGGFEDTFDTIVYAIGREADLESINCEKVGVETKNNKKIKVNDYEETTVPNIYAIGDAALARPELTPAAIKGGEQLASRLYSNSRTKITDYINIPTTVFTPLEYSCCGYSEEAAEEKFGAGNIVTYHRNVMPLEWNLAHRPNDVCYMKMIVTKADNVVVGLHYCGPNAGEIMQGFAVAMKMKATKDVFDETVGIHPTNAEWFTSLSTTKQSGEELTASGC